MINLRYHVVSLVAVFLALGMGIVMGSTVIDRVTVDTLNDNLNRVKGDINRTREDNQRLAEAVRHGQEYADQALTQVVRDQLPQVPVMVIAINGIDRKPVDSLRQSLLGAGATVEGTIWLTAKMRLTTESDVAALAAALSITVPPAQGGGPATGGPTTTNTAAADSLRRTAIDRLVSEPGSLAALVSAGFLAYEPPPAGTPTSATTAPPAVGSLPLPDTRFVLVSGAGAEVGDELAAVPLAEALASSPAKAVAAESGQDTDGGRGVFVGLLRSDAAARDKVSTVDNLESPMGQAAVVLALGELGSARVGHFGVGPGAQRLLPALAA
ncbi:MAG: hypothetical protein QOJ69_1670 [Actinomycetota bacterium]|nr:hypothetical protein [Actinomycetota bacterium]